MVALSEAFEEEQNKLKINKNHCRQIQLKLMERKRKMKIQTLIWKLKHKTENETEN